MPVIEAGVFPIYRYYHIRTGYVERVLKYVEKGLIILDSEFLPTFSGHMTRLEIYLDAAFSKRRWVIHFMYWTTVLIWYAIFFGRQNNNYIQTFFFVGLLMPVTIGTSYFLNYFLVPRYLINERYTLFIIYFMYTLIGSVFLGMLISVLTFVIVAEFNIRNMSPASFDLFFLLTSLLMVVFLGLAIKLLLYWRKSKDVVKQLRLEKMEGELRFLKAQLNPHFLFNTLNNLYYLATQKSDLAPGAILQLSEILDYVLYTAKDKYVTIEQEWRQVQTYIALELLHYEDRLVVNARLTGNTSGCLISPMILMTLTENAFKHGVVRSKDQSWIKMHLQCLDGTISVSLSNSVSKGNTSQGGIGLENLRAQLDLLYPGRHELILEEGLDEFNVFLTLRNQ
jgi:sensor histidine kinase YesM